MNVQSRAHRTLRRLASYKSERSIDEVVTVLPSLRLGEEWVGVYKNEAESLNEAVAFSSTGVYMHNSDEWTAFDYAEILQNTIVDEKANAREVLVRTSTSTFRVQIRGGEGRQRDVFEVLRFLNRVKQDVSEARQKG